MSIEKLQAHYGFTKMPFRRDLPPGSLHRHAAHDTRLAGRAISFAGLSDPPPAPPGPGQLTIDEALAQEDQ